MKEYDLKEYSCENLPAKINILGNIRRIFSLKLSPKSEKVLADVKSFWTSELDFSEFSEFWHQEIKLPKLNFFTKKDKNHIEEENKL